SLGSLHALRLAVAEARLRDAQLWSVIAWQPPGGEAANRRAPCPPALLELWRDDAAATLTRAWGEAAGGPRAALEVPRVVHRGRPADVLLRLADREDDLLVVGAGRRGTLRRLLAGSVARQCVRRAGCAVLAVPPSAVEQRIRRAQRELVR